MQLALSAAEFASRRAQSAHDHFGQHKETAQAKQTILGQKVIGQITHMVLLLKGPDVLSDGFQLVLFGALDNMVSACVLVGCNKIGIVDARQGCHLFHVWHQLSLQLKIQYLHEEGYENITKRALEFLFHAQVGPCFGLDCMLMYFLGLTC